MLIRPVDRDSFSISFTVGLYGAAFGAAAVAAGFSVWQACLFSLLTFSGASQFAAVGVIGSGGSAISAIATSALLGTRNALYGLRMAPILKNRGIKRVLSAHVTIDESTGLAIRQNEINQMQRAFYLTGAGVFLFWNIFTLLGALGANAIGDPSAWGLDAAVPAAFLGLVWPRLTDRKLFLISILAMVFALALVPNVPAGVPVIATTLIAVIFGWKTTESK